MKPIPETPVHPRQPEINPTEPGKPFTPIQPEINPPKLPPESPPQELPKPGEKEKAR